MTLAPMPNGTVQLEIDDGVATITFDRADTLNSMNNDFMDDIRTGVETAERNRTVGVVVLTGSGRGFCSGADLNAVGPVDADGGQDGGRVIDGMDRHFNPTMRTIKNCSLPTMARVNGVAAGGGLGLALACDIAIAARSAFFVATFGPRLGIVPDMGATWSLPDRVGHTRAMAMAMLGDRITAQQAEEWGLIYKMVDDNDLDIEVDRITNILKRSSAEAMRRIRTSIEGASTRSFSDQLDIERDHQELLIPMNMAEGAAAFLEKREPNFR